MKAKAECLSCILNQILRVTKVATNDQSITEDIMKSSLQTLSFANLNQTPPEVAQPLYEIVYKLTNNDDPYKKIKMEHIKQALEIYPILKNSVINAEDPLLESLKVAIVGNAIDLGSTFDKVEINLDDFLKGNFILDDYKFFKQEVLNTNHVLFLGDNAGESVFDRILIESLESMGKTVEYVVKSKAIINDVTKEDAKLSGINNIIETGSKYAGTVTYSLKEDFLNKLYNSKLIIAKGQANYETLSEEELPIFFL
ncbi:MAG: ARMT1-like domain-containing protein, partial [Caldisericaceae bacterium]